eukprot:SM000001S04565  [mRNA]  locus=s1:891365:896493:- [translate_table: standard]
MPPPCAPLPAARAPLPLARHGRLLPPGKAAAALCALKAPPLGRSPGRGAAKHRTAGPAAGLLDLSWGANMDGRPRATPVTLAAAAALGASGDQSAGGRTIVLESSRHGSDADGGVEAAGLRVAGDGSDHMELGAAGGGDMGEAGDEDEALGEADDQEMEDEDNEEEEEGEDGGERRLADVVVVQEEALRLLEWPAVCRQVAAFASTPMGQRLAAAARLPLGASRAESEELLAQVPAAMAVELDFGGIADLSGVLRAARDGAVCRLEELCLVGTTMQPITALHTALAAVRNGCEDGAVQPLRDVMAGADLLPGLQGAVARCLDLAQASMLDCASEALADVRHRRTENLRALEALLKTKTIDRVDDEVVRMRKRLIRFHNVACFCRQEEAVRVAAAGGMDTALVTRRRARSCIAIRGSHKAQLLPGGVTLGVSKTGTTHFVEPKAAVTLNNLEKELASAVEAEEEAVLAALSNMVAGSSGKRLHACYDLRYAISDLLQRVTVLDLACARAKHAQWLGGARPQFVHENDNELEGERSGPASTSGRPADGGALVVELRQVVHPLLLAQTLLPPSSGSAKAESTRRGRASLTALLAAPRSEPPSSQEVDGEEDDRKDVPGTVAPVPIDLLVERRTRVVTITGPNTGGKTAALKTFGVCALMAKAGLFLPVCAASPCRLMWHDNIFADIGDEQSLEQSLSTFSGHVKRLCRILSAAGHCPLVLLDEVGSGTDPSEGMALATAVLHHLAEGGGLTVATTHFADLKFLKDHDTRFQNAGVEFDLTTLRPTYRLLWGQSGQSNAFAISEILGLDPAILARGKVLMGKLKPSDSGLRASELIAALLQQCKDQELKAEAAAAVLSEVEKMHTLLEEESQGLVHRESKLRQQLRQSVMLDVERARARMNAILDDFRSTKHGNVKATLAAIAGIAAEHDVDRARVSSLLAHDGPDDSTDRPLPDSAMTWRPRVGQRVLVRRLGSAAVTVVEGSEGGAYEGDTEELTVELGMLRMKVRLDEILPVEDESELSSGKGQWRSWTAEEEEDASKSTLQRAGDGGELKFDAAVQSSRNTLDLRGKRVEDALMDLDLALATSRRGSVLFIIHGLGTGAVKQAVLSRLKGHRNVAKFEQEGIMNPGCTVAYLQ